ncbi:DinB family protein [Leptolyngbya sp. 7M]|uniref:DinB family protein n=1 Tax=Leptolyngbya sp. 7M TaxID=2812896 RepID=UPI001B8CDD04|nr:DinB family protein [Leptolyngbya sp. 7M]QYO65507.1 hypothetical protein JVX88_01585 [Leptolyngbya sp. 7M]
MQTIEHLRQLFAYNDWANRRLIVALRSSRSQRALAILSHLLTTENEYYERLHGKNSTGFDFWPDRTLEECGEAARQNAERFDKLLKNFDDEGLDLRARYHTSEGIPHENTYRELLTHILVHSTIHRGNLMTLIRESGQEPPKIDYIIYLRETKYF